MLCQHFWIYCSSRRCLWNQQLANPFIFICCVLRLRTTEIGSGKTVINILKNHRRHLFIVSMEVVVRVKHRDSRHKWLACMVQATNNFFAGSTIFFCRWPGDLLYSAARRTIGVHVHASLHGVMKPLNYLDVGPGASQLAIWTRSMPIFIMCCDACFRASCLLTKKTWPKNRLRKCRNPATALPFDGGRVDTLLSSPGCTLKTIRKYFKHVCGNFRWRSGCVTSSNCLHACSARGFHARTSVRCLHDTNDLSALKPQCFYPPCLPHLFSAPVSGSHCFMGEPSTIRWTQGETIHTCGP